MARRPPRPLLLHANHGAEERALVPGHTANRGTVARPMWLWLLLIPMLIAAAFLVRALIALRRAALNEVSWRQGEQPETTGQFVEPRSPSGLRSVGGGDLEVEHPGDLETFDDVGGMETLKREVRETVGLLLDHPEAAERYDISWNGLLLHGPPGVGKTFFVRAIAGEYGLNLIHVSTGDLASSMMGGAAGNVETAFRTALQHLPCLLFFDEFDSVAARRSGMPDQDSRRTVNALLTELEESREERRLLVVAATNSIEYLDPAVIRPGRFDRHVRIDFPDEAARPSSRRSSATGPSRRASNSTRSHAGQRE